MNLYGKNKNGKFEVNAKLRMQIDIVPIKQADEMPVGQGRDEPNHDPYLPPPVGRISLSLNPFKMWKQCFGPAMRNRIKKFTTTILLIVCGIMCCVFVMPGVISNWITDIL